jgi:hypothetical protein
VERSCAKCGGEITACMGFVKAGDWLEAEAGTRPWTEVRELCGGCVKRWQWTAEGTWEPREPEALPDGA